MRSGAFVGERLQPAERGGAIVELPRCPQPPLEGRAVALGEVIEDIAFSLISWVLSSMKGRVLSTALGRRAMVAEV
jgi:hypothetical protein